MIRRWRWKFTCENYDINIDNGLYFGKKNLYTENQNIFISGISNNQIEYIKGIRKNIMGQIKLALISLSDKSNLKPLLDILKKNKIKLVALVEPIRLSENLNLSA